MNKNIKFKIWLEESNWMVEPISIDEIFGYQDQVLNGKLLKYTGQKDKNGIEI